MSPSHFYYTLQILGVDYLKCLKTATYFFLQLFKNCEHLQLFLLLHLYIINLGMIKNVLQKKQCLLSLVAIPH